MVQEAPRCAEQVVWASLTPESLVPNAVPMHGPQAAELPAASVRMGITNAELTTVPTGPGHGGSLRAGGSGLWWDGG